jgi:5-methylcytosine-specific restriction endonuclease McrA
MNRYKELLKRPEWQKKRLEIFERDSFACRVCNNDKITISVHHRRYLKDLKPWDYHESDLLTLCEKCHDLFHHEKKKLDPEKEKAALIKIRKRIANDKINRHRYKK